jgi:hypothetical protein
MNFTIEVTQIMKGGFQVKNKKRKKEIVFDILVTTL